jgi:hypothetical protein
VLIVTLKHHTADNGCMRNGRRPLRRQLPTAQTQHYGSGDAHSSYTLARQKGGRGALRPASDRHVTQNLV